MRSKAFLSTRLCSYREEILLFLFRIKKVVQILRHFEVISHPQHRKFENKSCVVHVTFRRSLHHCIENIQNTTKNGSNKKKIQFGAILEPLQSVFIHSSWHEISRNLLEKHKL